MEERCSELIQLNSVAAVLQRSCISFYRFLSAKRPRLKLDGSLSPSLIILISFDVVVCADRLMLASKPSAFVHHSCIGRGCRSTNLSSASSPKKLSYMHTPCTQNHSLRFAESVPLLFLRNVRLIRQSALACPRSFIPDKSRYEKPNSARLAAFFTSYTCICYSHR